MQDLSRDVLEQYANEVSIPSELERSSAYWRDLSGRAANQRADQSAPLDHELRRDRRYQRQGKAAFRAALLKLADNSVQVLKDTGAQGMITWDPEGEEFLGACYYGDPRLVPTFAPEMEFKNGRRQKRD